MNCKQCQQKILESFAGSENLPSSTFVGHLNSCAACREFFHGQQTLFLAIRDNLRSLANQPVPPSLLPSVRALMEEAPAPSRAWFYSSTVAAVTAAAFLTVNVGYRMRYPANSAKSSLSTSVASRNVDTPQGAPRDQQPRESSVRAPKIRPSVPAHSTTAPEVIVLAEEREAFAKFVSEVPEEPDVARALARSAPRESDSSVEIALLQIDKLEVQPLEGTATE
jgi:hypothetical protein